jgi:beta-galactosidase
MKQKNVWTFALALLVFSAGACRKSENGGSEDAATDAQDLDGVEGDGDADEEESPYTGPQGRAALSLNGTWEIEQGDLGDDPPAEFTHTVAVPGLVTLAEPAFSEVGTSSDLREAFWYRTTFTGPEHRAASILNVHKAKYGIRVWLNGRLLGDHLGSFTLASFNVTDVLVPDEPNTLIVRVGAHRESVPDTVPAGQDHEKAFWIPGIWDDVEIVSSGSPRIARTKIEPDIDSDAVVVKTTLVNEFDAPAAVRLTSEVSPWLDREAAYPAQALDVVLDPREERTVEQTVAAPDHHPWSPEDPFLYVCRSTVRAGDFVTDELETRFGMRKVEWIGGDDYSGRFYLNNSLYYLRGSNITVHRFFEDPLAAGLPWDEDWVRRLLSENPKRLGWNSMRMSLGRAPNLWYDVADEVGILIADEFMMWTATDESAGSWSVDEMAQEFTEWIQESWNHPSIAWWDAANETPLELSGQVIGRVRALDPTRQWENGGQQAPQGPGDPIEDHPYVFLMAYLGFPVDETVLDTMDGRPPGGGSTGPQFTWDDPLHPYIINEYAWLWIDRDGVPTRLTGAVYDRLLGAGPHDPDVYREAYAYLTGGMTEFWRAGRGYAGVQHFTYLGYSRENGETCDNFIDLVGLVLEPRWLEYAENAFAPLGLTIDSWAKVYPAGETVPIPVLVINDYGAPQQAVLEVMTVAMDGSVLTRSGAVEIDVEALGSGAYSLDTEMPAEARYMLFARLAPDDPLLPTVWSRRKIGFAHIGEIGPDPPFD